MALISVKIKAVSLLKLLLNCKLILLPFFHAWVLFLNFVGYLCDFGDCCYLCCFGFVSDFDYFEYFVLIFVCDLGYAGYVGYVAYLC